MSVTTFLRGRFIVQIVLIDQILLVSESSECEQEFQIVMSPNVDCSMNVHVQPVTQ